MNDDYDILIDSARSYISKAKFRADNDMQQSVNLLKKANSIITSLINKFDNSSKSSSTN